MRLVAVVIGRVLCAMQYAALASTRSSNTASSKPVCPLLPVIAPRLPVTVGVRPQLELEGRSAAAPRVVPAPPFSRSLALSSFISE